PEPPPPPPPPPPKETVQQLPKLPGDWERHINRAGGFAFGVPRGWKVSDRGDGSLIRSFDRLVAISIVPDRSGGALEIPVGQFASRAAEALPGFRNPLRLKGEGRFEHRYEGAEVRAVGTAKGGIEQRVSVIVLRRDEVATFTVVIAKNQREAAHPSKKLAERIVETLRSRPPRDRPQTSN
ncbi:MAG: hypothetical protein ACRDLO_14840, partial [Solirubrobacterales bacterium]